MQSSSLFPSPIPSPGPRRALEDHGNYLCYMVHNESQVTSQVRSPHSPISRFPFQEMISFGAEYSLELVSGSTLPLPTATIIGPKKIYIQRKKDELFAFVEAADEKAERTKIALPLLDESGKINEELQDILNKLKKRERFELSVAQEIAIFTILSKKRGYLQCYPINEESINIFKAKVDRYVEHLPPKCVWIVIIEFNAGFRGVNKGTKRNPVSGELSTYIVFHEAQEYLQQAIARSEKDITLRIILTGYGEKNSESKALCQPDPVRNVEGHLDDVMRGLGRNCALARLLSRPLGAPLQEGYRRLNLDRKESSTSVRPTSLEEREVSSELENEAPLMPPLAVESKAVADSSSSQRRRSSKSTQLHDALRSVSTGESKAAVAVSSKGSLGIFLCHKYQSKLQDSDANNLLLLNMIAPIKSPGQVPSDAFGSPTITTFPSLSHSREREDKNPTRVFPGVRGALYGVNAVPNKGFLPHANQPRRRPGL